MIVARPSKGRQARDSGFFIAALFFVIAAAPARQTKPPGLRTALPPRMPYAAGFVEGRQGRAKTATVTLSLSADRPRDDVRIDPPPRPVRAVPRAALPAEARGTDVALSALSARPAGSTVVSASDLVVF